MFFCISSITIGPGSWIVEFIAPLCHIQIFSPSFLLKNFMSYTFLRQLSSDTLPLLILKNLPPGWLTSSLPLIETSTLIQMIYPISWCLHSLISIIPTIFSSTSPFIATPKTLSFPVTASTWQPLSIFPAYWLLFCQSSNYFILIKSSLPPSYLLRTVSLKSFPSNLPQLLLFLSYFPGKIPIWFNPNSVLVSCQLFNSWKCLNKT